MWKKCFCCWRGNDFSSSDEYSQYHCSHCDNYDRVRYTRHLRKAGSEGPMVQGSEGSSVKIQKRIWAIEAGKAEC